LRVLRVSVVHFFFPGCPAPRRIAAIGPGRRRVLPRRPRAAGPDRPARSVAVRRPPGRVPVWADRSRVGRGAEARPARRPAPHTPERLLGPAPGRRPRRRPRARLRPRPAGSTTGGTGPTARPR